MNGLMRPDGPNTGKRDGQISSALSELEQSISILQDALQILENRLEVILLPPSPTGTSQDAKAKQIMVPLAEVIGRHISNIRYATERVTYLKDRIEL